MEYIKTNLCVEDVFLADFLYRDFFGLHADDAGSRQRLSFSLP